MSQEILFKWRVCDFLNGSEGVLPCEYLGLPAVANPRKMATWEALIEKIRRKLIFFRGISM